MDIFNLVILVLNWKWSFFLPKVIEFKEKVVDNFAIYPAGILTIPTQGKN